MIGSLAGAISALAANVISGLVSVRVFDLPWTFNWQVAVGGMLFGVGLVVLAGLWATRGVLASSPAASLRALQ